MPSWEIFSDGGPSGMADRYPRIGAAARLLAGAAGALVVFAVVAVLAGVVLGSPGPAGSAPPVDFDDDPAVVVATASERLAHRDYAVEVWTRRIDHRTGAVGGGLSYEARVESTRGQLRVRFQPPRSYDDGVVGDGIVGEAFVAEGAAWVRLQGDEYWQRSEPATDLARGGLAALNVSRAALERANLTVLVDNETTYVVRRIDGSTPAIDAGLGGTTRYVIAKGEDPHLAAVRHERGGRLETTTELTQVLDYGDTIAPRPADVPWTTVDEVWTRTVRGLGWIP